MNPNLSIISILDMLPFGHHAITTKKEEEWIVKKLK